MNRRQAYILIAILGLALDQGLKSSGFFGYYLNRDFTWGLPIPNMVSIVLMFLFLLVVVWLYFRRSGQEAIFLIMAGAASNLADRIFRGGVVDYINLPLGGIINLADILIIAGIVLCLRK